MALIRVGISHLVATVTAALPKRKNKKRILAELGAAAMAEWTRLAQVNLRSSSEDYIDGLQYNSGDDRVTITLEGMLPNMIENGWPGGDMRQWLLKGPNVKMGKNGPYNTVPFRHGTPGTTGRNVGRPMPMAIYGVAKGLRATVSRPGPAVGGYGGRTTLYGERLGYYSRGMTEQAKHILERVEKPWHAVSIYKGMIRERKKYNKATQTGGYTTFRRISMHSRGKLHWIHPGIKPPRKFALQVQKHIESIAASVVALVIEE
jgi:hypothetical protein